MWQNVVFAYLLKLFITGCSLDELLYFYVLLQYISYPFYHDIILEIFLNFRMIYGAFSKTPISIS